MSGKTACADASAQIGADRWKALTDLLFEVGMLRHTPRTGYQFLGSGKESVAEHSFRTTVTGFVLAQLAGADWAKVVLMCLFHDLHETRTGDFNYVNKMYNTSRDDQAAFDAWSGTGLGQNVLDVLSEMEEASSLEAILAQDADQLDLILSLKQEQDLGNAYAQKWITHALDRLRSDLGRDLAQAIIHTDHTDWWFRAADSSWWSRKNGQ
ncbi:MAG: HD domain-containing protein [Desulfovermiculus sp.]|nr:HD domain-containing protein [Desulfovermiculus sp.]